MTDSAAVRVWGYRWKGSLLLLAVWLLFLLFGTKYRGLYWNCATFVAGQLLWWGYLVFFVWIPNRHEFTKHV